MPIFLQLDNCYLSDYLIVNMFFPILKMGFDLKSIQLNNSK